jgi:hypothetical protein
LDLACRCASFGTPDCVTSATGSLGFALLCRLLKQNYNWPSMVETPLTAILLDLAVGSDQLFLYPTAVYSL